MARQTTPLKTFIEEHFTFSTQSTGDEVEVSHVYNYANGKLQDYSTIAQVESALATVAKAQGFEPTRCFIYRKSK